jgi:hypothetical protein
MHVGFISALPLLDLRQVEWRALFILGAILVSTLVGIFALRRFTRVAQVSLAVASALSLWWLSRISPWTMMIHVLEGTRTFMPATFMGVLLATLTSIIVPIGFIVALPLRRDTEPVQY